MYVRTRVTAADSYGKCYGNAGYICYGIFRTRFTDQRTGKSIPFLFPFSGLWEPCSFRAHFELHKRMYAISVSVFKILMRTLA